MGCRQASFAGHGARARVIEVQPARSDESKHARDTALNIGVVQTPTDAGDERLVVDALLGTGSVGSVRGEIKEAANRIAKRRKDGAVVVSLDVPSGLDATTGEHDGAVAADLTISFGTMKRGTLISRGPCGDLVVVGIGLSDGNEMQSLPHPCRFRVGSLAYPIDTA